MITPYGNPLCKAAVTLCAAIFVLLLTAAADAQTGRITGTVTAGDAKGPLAGATVEVIGPNLKTKMVAVSKADGRYAVENVPAGAYTVKATSVGYRSETVKGVGVAAGASVEVDFRMATTPYEMEEMVVSASRHAENIVDAPASISKVDGEEVERNAVANSYAGLLKNLRDQLFPDQHLQRVFQRQGVQLGVRECPDGDLLGWTLFRCWSRTLWPQLHCHEG